MALIPTYQNQISALLRVMISSPKVDISESFVFKILIYIVYGKAKYLLAFAF